MVLGILSAFSIPAATPTWNRAGWVHQSHNSGGTTRKGSDEWTTETTRAHMLRCFEWTQIRGQHGSAQWIPKIPGAHSPNATRNPRVWCRLMVSIHHGDHGDPGLLAASASNSSSIISKLRIAWGWLDPRIWWRSTRHNEIEIDFVPQHQIVLQIPDLARIWLEAQARYRDILSSIMASKSSKAVLSQLWTPNHHGWYLPFPVMTCNGHPCLLKPTSPC